ncbi:hypothetical protein HXX01_04310, partial [Candidatus Nomurabacteria bacterium]|nr:hypothetical protein [Candidatus Nomurabacteria bacterium]
MSDLYIEKNEVPKTARNGRIYLNNSTGYQSSNNLNTSTGVQGSSGTSGISVQGSSGTSGINGTSGSSGIGYDFLTIVAGTNIEIVESGSTL